MPPREDPRDALVARDGLVLGELPAGSKVGTSAPRRIGQLLALGLGLDLVPLRGNLDTRLGKVASGDLDAIVVARAGLARIGRLDAITEALEPVQMLPAPAQGALAVECRADDTEIREILAGLDDAGTRAAVTAERTLLAELEAGCTAPVGALGRGGRVYRRRRPHLRRDLAARLRGGPRRQRRAARVGGRRAGRRRSTRARGRRANSSTSAPVT